MVVVVVVVVVVHFPGRIVSGLGPAALQEKISLRLLAI